MKQKLITVYTTIVAIVLLTPMATIAGEDAKQAAVANLVRHMGYGAAMHSFKNFVLRGKDKHMTDANQHLDSVAAAIADLRKLGLSDDEKAALNDIESVMGQYQAALANIKDMVAAGKSAKEIDAAVKISDGPAKAGLKTLGAGSSSDLAKIEYALGYGNAIHLFKNCVIRGKQENCESAKAAFDEAMAVLGGMSGPAAEGIKTTVMAYQNAIPTVIGLIGEGKSPEEIDATVKIDDKPAKEGLAALK